MQDAKKNNGGNGNQDSNKKKKRHIVSWTQEEDDMLGEQISQHGTENWRIIGSNFKDKTTRQCRRRWFTYLNSDFKKGGWSPEEDMLLCEAQKIFGKRWTEIFKVVSDQNNKTQGTFLKKDDLKISALMQQAELLSSLARKINMENTEQSLENAWKVLQDSLNQSKENDIIGFKVSDIDFHLEDFKDFIEDLRSSNQGSHPSFTQLDLYEASPASSEYSTGSTLMPHPAGDKTEQTQTEMVALHQDIRTQL